MVIALANKNESIIQAIMCVTIPIRPLARAAVNTMMSLAVSIRFLHWL